ncbi:hypothetical protein [Floridanema aerugineum]|jgi:uncharacterized zinc-type alcohol dehydrogenase-like protein|uniref:Uncharacterized protein n=1 Tax=Floridaenema aerugineum BLCC-F46 TaxID=3153654 RepID=A0ABV4X748_9CYAN
MSSGQEIGVIGIGGLGHLAVQFASKLGNSVTVFTTSQDKAEFAHQLGANYNDCGNAFSCRSLRNQAYH